MDQNRGPGFEIRACYGRFADMCYASWAFLSRDSSSRRGARKDSAPESRIFFPKKKRILHLPRLQKPVLETDFMRRSEGVSEDSLIALA